MKRSTSVLGAVLALALAAQPAWADTPMQATTQSTSTCQIGAQSGSVPVRVLSDGGDSSSAGTATAEGGQTAAGSDGVAQVGSSAVRAPVRVLSDGDDAVAGDAGSGVQAADGSSGGAQVGSQTASAPVRVASDGDGGTSSAAPADGGQTATGSAGATQVGSVGADVPVSVLSNDGNDPDTTGGDDGAEVVEEVTEAGVDALTEVLGRGIREAAAATGSTTEGAVATPVTGVARLLETSAAALRGVASSAAGSSSGGAGGAGTLGSGDLAESPGAGGIGDTAVLRGDGGASLPLGAGLVPAALVDVAGSLPLTGVSAWLLIAAGVWLLLSGLALLFSLTLFRAPGRRIGFRDATPLPARRFVR